MTPFPFVPRKSSCLTVRAQIHTNETAHGRSEGLLLLALTKGSIGGAASRDSAAGRLWTRSLQLAAYGPRAGRCGGRLCSEHSPARDRQGGRRAVGSTGRSPEQPSGPPHMHQRVPSGWHQQPRRRHTTGMCLGHGQGPGAHAAQQRFLAVGSWEPGVV